MRKAQKLALWGALAFVGASAIFAVAWYLRRPPKSLADGLVSRPDEFPASYNVFLPPSSDSRLGRPARPPTDRRVVVDGRPCFHVAPEISAGLTTLNIAYRASSDIGVEFGSMFKAGASTIEGATLNLSDLHRVTGALIPMRNAECDFVEGDSTFQVVTAELVAGHAELGVSASGSGSAEFAASNPDASAQQVSARSGWQASSDGRILGKDIVVGGKTNPVTVNTRRSTVQLGSTPRTGSHPLPQNLDGRLVVKRYDDAMGILEVNVQAADYTGVAKPIGMPHCPLNVDIPLEREKDCVFWLAPGSASVYVWWTVDAANEVVVSMIAYRTKLSDG